MRFRVDTRDDIQIITLTGQVSIGQGVAELRKALTSASRHRGRRVVVDLGDVPFVDSAGLGELVAGSRQLAQSGGRLCVAAPRAKVADLMDLTRLDDLIPVYATVEEALEGLRGGHSSTST